MTLADLVDGESVFLDANILVYHFAPHPVFGLSSSSLAHRIETGQLIGYTSRGDIQPGRSSLRVAAI